MLGKGNLMRGRVMDPTGQPIVGATVFCAEDERYRNTYEWSTKTDAEGRFKWNTAPIAPQRYNIFATGYIPNLGLFIKADGIEQVVTLGKSKPMMRVSGKVVDADTQQPLQNFQVTQGRDNWGSYSASDTEEGRDGAYAIQLRRAGRVNAVKISAAGYIPQISPWFGNTNDSAVYDFALKKGTGPQGRVLSPTGKPLAEVEVGLCTDRHGVVLGHHRMLHRENYGIIRDTDREGRFAFPAELGAHLVIMVHEQGYAEIAVEKLAIKPDVILQPWGRIEGTMRLGTELAAGHVAGLLTVDIQPHRRSMTLSPATFNVTNDANGQFVFEAVPPGEFTVCRLVPHGKGATYSYGLPVSVRPGETTRIEHGGSGRLVKARLVAKDSRKKMDWQRAQTVSLVAKIPQPEIPETVKNAPAASAWWQEFLATEKGQEYRRRMVTIPFQVETDGTIVAHDVPPGEYKVVVLIVDEATDNLGSKKLMQNPSKTVQVPSPAAPQNVLLDLGIIEVE